ncbi:putative Co/Zn/Cd cation transporter (cation efflux family) [Actinocorallia herbida]|uniref:Putative Co/Zn/Cd cation transporter (Cation efflux family) n=1 Tax=Actinocorallia herbida TaxID=58109 RepID=A0A3N1CUL3_9ACTN|nr:cation transporter [Actinocorallia herbida]ROO84925.1 putative Co/Zn/Cd cation transporter (cation efflux family) [Actinocorallia herbida]
MAVSAGLGCLALVWGFAAGSQVILLDGVYVVLGLGLSGLALYASRVAAAGPTPRFPFGREPLVPMVVGVQGLALFGTLAYAAVEAVRVILGGGSEVAPVSLAAYGVAGGLASLATYGYLVRRSPRTDLIRAEAAGWLAGAASSLIIAVGGAVALVLGGAGWRAAAAYSDSVLVLVTCVALIGLPVRMLRQAVSELLDSAPEPAVLRRIRDAVERARAAEGLPEPVLRAGKVGGRIYVEVGFVVPAGRWDIADEDRVRRTLHDELMALPYTPWIVVEITTDPGLL